MSLRPSFLLSPHKSDSICFTVLLALSIDLWSLGVRGQPVTVRMEGLFFFIILMTILCRKFVTIVRMKVGRMTNQSKILIKLVCYIICTLLGQCKKQLVDQWNGPSQSYDLLHSNSVHILLRNFLQINQIDLKTIRPQVRHNRFLRTLEPSDYRILFHTNMASGTVSSDHALSEIEILLLQFCCPHSLDTQVTP